MSNEGIGSMENSKSAIDFAQIDKFYQEIGNFAKEHGITINLVAIEGDECNL